VRLNYSCPAAQECRAFEQWLAAESSHRLAWQRVNGLKGFQSGLGPQDSDDTPHLLPRQLARDTLQAAQDLRKARSASRRQAVKLFAGIGAAAAGGCLARDQVHGQRVLANTLAYSSRTTRQA